MKKYIFDKSYDRVLKILEEYKPLCNQYCKEASEKVAYEQYGRGGECLHRGYYCPSMIMDIVVGNCKRGKILQKKPTRKNPDYIYGFDAEDKMVMARCRNVAEIIIHLEEVQIGICLYNGDTIETISECVYDNGKIVSYLYALYNPYKEQITELRREEYTYLENKVIVDWYRLDMLDKSIFKNHTRYIFAIEDGYLKSYTIEEYDGDRIKDSVWNGHIWEVSPPRKLWF